MSSTPVVSLSNLESHLWESANILRGPVDAADFKTYIFPLLFFKRVCDVWDEEYQEIVEDTGDEQLAWFPESHRFQIPEDCHWVGSTIPWPAFPICMSAILAVKLGNSFGTSHAAIHTADELLKRLTKNQWEYYLNECLPGDELVLQKLSWYGKPRNRWIELVGHFQLPAKADKSSLVTKLLAASHKAEDLSTATAAKALLDAMQK